MPSPRSYDSNCASDLVQIEKLPAKCVDAECAGLQEQGVRVLGRRQYKKPIERPFTREQRANTTVLFGGLTWKHEKLVQAALDALGYHFLPLPVPDVRAFQIGKEFGNNGQCNPTYFTVGNLVQYLQSLEQQGLRREQIIDRYVFYTAGACGPCRFGMYESEYRLALRNSGFEDFRVIVFQQSGGLTQSDVEAGIEMNPEFFLGILNALCVGDLVNEAAYAVRPFETTKGQTERTLERIMASLQNTFRMRKRCRRRTSRRMQYFADFVDQLTSDDYACALRAAADELNAVEVDRLRVKPVVKITGEFWAQTTEGDGNFHMFRFLESEGAQVLVEPIGTWITYMIHQVVQKYRDTKGLEQGTQLPPIWSPVRRGRVEAKHLSRVSKCKAAELVFKREYRRFAKPFGGLVHELVDQYELQRLGHPFYNSRAGGGEGHLEVAKNIYYANRGLAHMVLSLKPFGCMPSTQSDAAQTAVVARYPDMIFLPIETSGEGEINAHSRVQMALGEARNKAKLEFTEALRSTGLSVERCYEYVQRHPELKRPLYRVPQTEGVVGVAANLVYHIAERLSR